MSSVCLYFQVHQPRRIKKFRHSDIGTNAEYFDDENGNSQILNKVATKAYLPTNKLMLELLKTHAELKLSYSFSGVVLEQFEKYAPDVLQSFVALVDTGRVEILSETYYHSLSFLGSKEEFEEQVTLHKAKVAALFGQTPKVFRNTELIYNNDLALYLENMGYMGVLAEGADHVLDWQSPAFLYTPPNGNIRLLLKNYRLSDDIAFRFSEKSWKDYPLTAEKFSSWVNQINGNGELVNLFMDYETFGEHQWEDSGIFAFLRQLPSEILKHPDNDFVTPSEAVERYQPKGFLDVANFISWADTERDLSAWLSNSMQQDAMAKLYDLRNTILSTKDSRLIEDWRHLTTSDHFYYMCTKWFADGDVHKYFNPYESPYDAFRYFMNVLTDIKLRLES